MVPVAATRTKPRSARGFVVFKWAVYALLAGNVALYAYHGSLTETVDTAAWVALLLLFEWETGGWGLRGRTLPIARALRALAALAIVWAWTDYGLAREWLDFGNASAWLGVVLILELELRIGPHWRRFHRWRRLTALTLYLALGAFVVVWAGQGLRGVEGAWLDAWDAALWLAAFLAIELNVFRWAPD